LSCLFDKERIIYENKFSLDFMNGYRFFLLLITLGISALPAQELTPKSILKVGLASDFQSYFKAMEAQDFDLVLDLTHSSLFELVPRNLMLQNLKDEATEGAGEVHIHKTQLLGSPVMVEDEGHFYALLNYALEMEVVVPGGGEMGELEEEEEDFEGDDLDEVALTLDLYKTRYGPRSVNYLAAEKLVRIQAKGKLLAIQSKDEYEEDGWKFIEYRDSMRPLIQQLLPAEVLEKLEQ
jgi:hypothetical protein